MNAKAERDTEHHHREMKEYNEFYQKFCNKEHRHVMEGNMGYQAALKGEVRDLTAYAVVGEARSADREVRLKEDAIAFQQQLKDEEAVIRRKLSEALEASHFGNRQVDLTRVAKLRICELLEASGQGHFRGASSRNC